MKTRGWAITDVGRKRDHNEDSFLCNDGMRLYAVADGMGGHLGGERASRMAVEILEREVGAELTTLDAVQLADAKARGDGAAPHPVAAAVKRATALAAKAIHETAHADEQFAGMGTTLTSVLFHGDHLTLCHVGD